MFVVQNRVPWIDQAAYHEWLDACIPTWEYYFFSEKSTKWKQDNYRFLIEGMMTNYCYSDIQPVLPILVQSRDDLMLLKLAWPIGEVEEMAPSSNG